MPSKSEAVPKNWPPTLPYLTAPAYSQNLTSDHISSLRKRPKDVLLIPANTPKGPYSVVKIIPITISSHPANGQCGLFAAKDLKPGTFILQYFGEIHVSPSDPTPSTDQHANSNYDLSLDRDLSIGIDADKKGNEARFINDYRGVMDKPNAEFKEIWDERRKERGMGVWVLPEGKSGKGKSVRKGEEILVSYGRGFWDARKGGESEK